MPEPYEVDDRGNVAQFYSTDSNEVVATLDREAEVDGVADQATWDGGPDVTAWAVAHGYPHVATLPKPE
jgi:hypothetical protein